MKSITRRAFLQNSAVALSTAGALLHVSPLLAQPQPPTSNTLRFGVNYVPRRGWWYCWQDWNQQSIADDLKAIADLGMDHIRAQCLWPIFQPGVNYVSSEALERLVILLDSADRAGLDVEVTVLNGWMSGLSFMPAWTQPNLPSCNIFTDRRTIEAEKLLFTKLASTIGRHPRFLGFDLGNELGVLMGKDNPATPAEADRWATDLLSLCAELAPGKFHVNGVDHQHWFSDSGFTRQNLATTGSSTIVHSYAYFTGALKKFGCAGVGTSHLAEYQAELAFAYHEDPARRVWIEEVGVSPEWTPEEHLLDYADTLVRNAASTGKLWGITWWCSHDIEPAIKSFSSLEYTLGLIGLNNKPKPLGKKLAALASEFRHSRISANNRGTALVIPDVGLNQASHPPDWTYGDRFMKLVVDGKTPCIVCESRAKDEDYLRSRGIRNLIPLRDV
ncbi:MAG: cellulase family glycosylhydrolase [Acidobacteriaceae bacterium]|nr:cellulase family glycosylhydrolase [Acidobacteriaceae bacterium]